MDDCYVGDDGYVRMLVLLATSMVMMMVPVMVTIGNGSEAYWSCEENADRDTRVVALMVRNTICLLYTSPSPRDRTRTRMPSSA